MTPALEAIVARHVKTIEEVHQPSGLVTHPESCLTCDKAWPCDARQLADALTAAEARADKAETYIRRATGALDTLRVLDDALNSGDGTYRP